MNLKFIIALCATALAMATPSLFAETAGEKSWDVNNPDFSAKPRTCLLYTSPSPRDS